MYTPVGNKYMFRIEAAMASNKWDIMLSLFTTKDSLNQPEYLVYEHETVTIKQLYSVNVIT